MSNTSKVTIEITKTGARIESISINGSKNIKTVSVADLASVFAKNAVLDSGILPTSDGIVYYGHHSDKEIVVYTKPPMVRTLSFRTEQFRVPVPRTYFFVSLSPNLQTGTKKIMATYMFAANGVLRNKTDQLRKFPFCNVYGAGNICWGGNTLSPISDLYGVEYYFDLFWSSPFNGDLEPSLVPQGKSTKDYFSWASQSKATEFDATNLPSAGSFNDAIAKLIRSV